MLKLKGKKVFNEIKKHALSLANDDNIRTWGYSITLRSDSISADNLTYEYREKFLVFGPRGSIVLESHVGYSEIWTADRKFEYAIEDANGRIVKRRANKFERVYIPKGCKHKIINTNKTILNIFEVQIGQINNK